MLGSVRLTIDNPPAKLPAVIGIYYSPEFRNHEEQLWKKGDRWDFPLGPSSVAAFDQAIPMVFEKTLPVQNRTPLADGGVVDGVVEPRLESFDFQLPWLKTGTYSSEINYRVLLYDKSGVTVASWIANGVGEINGQAGFEFARWPGESADLAVQNAMQKFVSEFAKQPDVQIWLHKSVRRVAGADRQQGDFGAGAGGTGGESGRGESGVGHGAIAERVQRVLGWVC